jgi:hypothetical protein
METNGQSPLTEEEKRYLRALRLFLEKDGADMAKKFDEVTPDNARAAIAGYHLMLEHGPEALIWSTGKIDRAAKIDRFLPGYFRAYALVLQLRANLREFIYGRIL